MPEIVAFLGARVVDPASGRDRVEDVLVEDGSISACGPRLDFPAGATRFDCDGAKRIAKDVPEQVNLASGALPSMSANLRRGPYCRAASVYQGNRIRRR